MNWLSLAVGAVSIYVAWYVYCEIQGRRAEKAVRAMSKNELKNILRMRKVYDCPTCGLTHEVTLVPDESGYYCDYAKGKFVSMNDLYL